MLNLGEYEVIEHKGTVELPQDAASAWAAFDGGKMTGAAYKPVAYLARNETVNGVNYLFMAEQTIIVGQPERHYVFVLLNELGGKYTTVNIEREV